MRYCCLSSGSKQNCFYVETPQTAILIDMGLSFRALRAMLEQLHRSVDAISAVFVTHEHSDHTRGLAMLAKKTHIPIFIHSSSHAALGYGLRNVRDLLPDQTVNMGDIAVQPFPVRHDAHNTFGFLISTRDRTLFHASDIESYTAETLTRCQGAHAIAIESNYDPVTLQRCSYPPFLKARINGPNGHLSNPDAAQFLLSAISGTTTNVFLLHLSENSNSRQLVAQQVDTDLQPVHQHIQYHIAYRDRSLPLVEL